MKAASGDRHAPHFEIPWALIVFLVTLVVFLPALRNSFVDWDDGVWIVSNPHIRGLSRDNLAWMFSTLNLNQYLPLTWLSLALDYSLWGLNPIAFHATNVVLHAFSAALFFRIGQKLLPDPIRTTGAFIGALIFSLHPLRVESVAWAFERKDVLSGFFLLASTYAYLQKGPRWRWASLACYALSLFSKAVGVGFPFVLILLDVYALRRKMNWRLLIEKVPYAILALIVTFANLYSFANAGRGMSMANYGVGMRAAQAVFGLSFYFEKMIWPLHLSPRYLHPSLNFLAWPYLARALAFAALCALVWGSRKKYPACLAALGAYILLLAPVLGAVPQSSQIAADRYSYLPCLGWELLAGAALARCGRASWPIACALLILLSGLTSVQIRAWHDSVSLWSLAVQREPNDIVSHEALGKALTEQGKYAEAFIQFQAALAINSDYAPAHNDLGVFFAKQKRLDEAEKQFEVALALDPGDAEARGNLERAKAALANFHRR